MQLNTDRRFLNQGFELRAFGSQRFRRLGFKALRLRATQGFKVSGFRV